MAFLPLGSRLPALCTLHQCRLPEALWRPCDTREGILEAKSICLLCTTSLHLLAALALLAGPYGSSVPRCDGANNQTDNNALSDSHKSQQSNKSMFS